jgi:hypothetical protein
MNKPFRFIFQITSIALCFLVNASFINAQEGSSWWKNIFRYECDTTQIVISDSSITIKHHIENHNDSVDLLIEELPVLEKRLGLGSVQIYMDSSVMNINESAIDDVKPLKGYRVQIHFGDLESARTVRARCRRQIPNHKVYMESIAPNYIVSVGNYRDRWGAEFALGSLKKLYPNAVIVPTDIELPKL